MAIGSSPETGALWSVRAPNWARSRPAVIGYNAIALPIAAGIFEPAFGLTLRPEIAALSMSGSSVIVAVNALMLKRLRLLDHAR